MVSSPAQGLEARERRALAGVIAETLAALGGCQTQLQRGAARRHAVNFPTFTFLLLLPLEDHVQLDRLADQPDQTNTLVQLGRSGFLWGGRDAGVHDRAERILALFSPVRGVRLATEAEPQRGKLEGKGLARSEDRGLGRLEDRVERNGQRLGVSAGAFELKRNLERVAARPELQLLVAGVADLDGQLDIRRGEDVCLVRVLDLLQILPGGLAAAIEDVGILGRLQANCHRHAGRDRLARARGSLAVLVGLVCWLLFRVLLAGPVSWPLARLSLSAGVPDGTLSLRLLSGRSRRGRGWIAPLRRGTLVYKDLPGGQADAGDRNHRQQRDRHGLEFQQEHLSQTSFHEDGHSRGRS